jgi:hypothetical protein
MNKCLKITLIGSVQDSLLEHIKSYARTNSIQGLLQKEYEFQYKIIVYGLKDHIDSLIDSLHERAEKEGIDEVDIEPFIKDKDYRGVFRIVQG